MPSMTGMLTRNQAKELAHLVAHETAVACFMTDRAADIQLSVIVRRCLGIMDEMDEARRKKLAGATGAKLAGMRRAPGVRS